MKIEIGANEAGQRLDKFLRKYLKDVPLSAIFKAMRKGDIRVNGSKQKENYKLEIEDVIEIRYIQSKKEKNDDSFIKVNAGSLMITYEDDNIVVVEKWPGVLVHPDQKGAEPSLTDYVLSYLNGKGDYIPEKEITFTPAPCNRLDRNTSGVVIFGKNFEALRGVNEMIREGKVKKYYQALVKGRIKDGLYKGYISKDENENISKVYDKQVPNTKEIAMEVKTLQSNGAFSLLEIDLITGRSHQIRAHLSHLGNPIIGDFKYGDKKINSYFDNKFGLNYQFLYAYKLIFKGGEGKLEYLKNKTVVEALPPMFKKVKNEVFKFTI